VAKGKDIHVVPRGGKWAVEPAGGRPTSTHRTQHAAIDTARPQARRNESELVIHDREGQIRDKDSHGHDPNPPRG
jgi:hypothetical protein